MRPKREFMDTAYLLRLVCRIAKARWRATMRPLSITRQSCSLPFSCCLQAVHECKYDLPYPYDEQWGSGAHSDCMKLHIHLLQTTVFLEAQTQPIGRERKHLRRLSVHCRAYAC